MVKLLINPINYLMMCNFKYNTRAQKIQLILESGLCCVHAHVLHGEKQNGNEIFGLKGPSKWNKWPK